MEVVTYVYIVIALSLSSVSGALAYEYYSQQTRRRKVLMLSVVGNVIAAVLLLGAFTVR